MNSRHNGILGLTVLGLALAGPVHAAPDFMDDAFIVARAEGAHQGPRDARKNERSTPQRGVEREEPRGYGYGYERRHQREHEEDRGEDRRRSHEKR